MKSRTTLFYRIFAIFVTLALMPAAAVQAQTPKTLAVLPFTIHADKNMDYAKKGICRMFYSRLSWPEKVGVIPPVKMEGILAKTQGQKGNDLIKAIARTTKSDFVVSGTITQLAGAFSIDAKVFDLENKRYMTFFEQSKNGDELIKKVDRIAAAINHRVFERSTVTWEKMEQEKQQHLNELKRKNPEHMMQLPPGWQPEEEIGWKVWKYLF